VIGCALTDSVRHKGNSRLKEVGMRGQAVATGTSVESGIHVAIAELIRAMHTDACGDAGARWSLVPYTFLQCVTPASWSSGSLVW